jgi:hypothetical protein
MAIKSNRVFVPPISAARIVWKGNDKSMKKGNKEARDRVRDEGRAIGKGGQSEVLACITTKQLTTSQQ